MRATLGYIVSLAIGLSVNACSKSDKCELGEADSCDSGLACEAVEGGDAICVPETVVTGKVFDAETLDAVAGARVVVLDADTNAAASNVALTDAQGNFRARIQLRRSTEEGDDVKSGIYTLRVSATAYQEFPSPIRQAVPLTVTRADDKDELPTTRATSRSWLWPEWIRRLSARSRVARTKVTTASGERSSSPRGPAHRTRPSLMRRATSRC